MSRQFIAIPVLIYLFRLLSPLNALLPGQSDAPFNAYQVNKDTTGYIPLPYYPPAGSLSYFDILLTYSPTQINGYEVGYNGFIEQLVHWLSPANTVSTVPPDDGEFFDGDRLGIRISPYEECKRMYRCLYSVLAHPEVQNPEGDINDPNLELYICINSVRNQSLACEIYLTDVRTLSQDSCGSRVLPSDFGGPWDAVGVDTDQC